MRLRGTRVQSVLATLGLLAGLAVTVAAAPVAAAAPVLPTGFLLQDIDSGLQPGDQLTDFAYLPDESLITIGKTGKVAWVPQVGSPRVIATLSVSTNGDMGLVGIAVAPDYATSHTVYTARTVPSTQPGSGQYGMLRLSRWTVSTATDGSPTGLGGEQTLVQTSADGLSHGITGVIAAEDGTVWVSIGDSADYNIVDPVALRALNPDDLHGKLLHLRQDGSGAPANPYYDAAHPRSVRSLTYASGFRSPFRFTLEPVTGRPILGDVGWYTTEELDVVNPGNNYGWPCWEGGQPTPGYRDLPGCAGATTASPLWSYPHRSGGGAVAAGVVYTGASYPAEYRGRLFFGDYVFGQIFTLRTNERGELVTPPEPNGFGSDLGNPVKLSTVPTGGDIVFADIGAARIRRLVYAPGNNPPQAVLRSTTDPATRTVRFDAAASTDPNGDPFRYRWDFGDGSAPVAGDDPVTTHTYPASPDHFTATLTVTDPLDAAGTATATVYPANRPPTLSLTAPRDDTTFAVGDSVTASATSSDTEDGPLPVSWSVLLVHCTAVAYCHDHPGEQQSGPNFQMVFTGHPGNSRLEITASAADSRGATTSRTFVAHPKQRRVSIESNTAATFTIGAEQTTSGLFTVGTNLSIVAPANAQDGVASFERWGDGNTDRVRQLVLPDADQVLPVSYSTPIDRRYAADGALRDRVGTPVAVEQGDSTVRWREYTAGRVYWSPGAGAHYLAGAILQTYLVAGGHLVYGVPTTDETSRDNVGTFNELERGAIYWSPYSGTHFVVNGIRARYRSLNAELSFLGYPTSDETSRDNYGTYNHFQYGSIFWSPATGINYVINGIRAKYAAYGWELSFLGYPTSDETSRDGYGTYNHFQGGSIFWSPATGVHSVVNGIRAQYAQLGWERSYLGYPTSDEFAVPGGARSNFRNGYITWNAVTGQITDHRY
ncbi:MAG TPA: PQQ-dependent sugar dehydrogenase [Actinophytocola sp.]|uniref:PQQ-dependent sugar dehydrogenase n=1 Tax=Actinophytocola sp. TaxID=1872138 RepID=UPI002E0B3FAF|nr:PQQ-dependent sugar dehydrogenase [Actinophytocola sp.]